MATLPTASDAEWTVADILDRFGPIPASRIVTRPKPGEGTVEDVVRLDDHENRRCELIDGVLVEKAMGFIESQLANQLIALITAFVNDKKLGVTGGEAGMLQLFPEEVRIPDVSYISWERLEGSGYPDEAAPLFAPDLAVEVLSKSNTRREMDSKLAEYFEAGVRLVWYVEPKTKTVTVYKGVDQATVLTEADTLTGGEVLPGLEIELRKLFELPKPPKG